MMKQDEYLTIEAYPKVKEIVDGIFYATRLLPNYVFKKRYRFTLIANCDHIISENLISILHDRRFCRPTDNILLSVLDPDPIAYFHKHFGKINSIRFKAGISEEDYGHLRWLDPGNATDAIQFNTNNLVWIPDNGRWAIWGERDREIAVIGFDDPAQADFLLNEVGYWIDAETALDHFASAPYRDHKAPEDFARPLIANYGSRKDLERKLAEAGLRLKPGIWADDAG